MTPPRTGGLPLISRRAAFWAVAAMLFLVMFSSAAPTPMYGIYRAQWHFSAVTVTVIFAVYALALLAALLVAGRLSDYFGRRPVLAAGMALNAAACVVWLLAPGTGALLAARVLQGVSVGVATGPIGASLLELQPPDSSAAGVITSASQPMGLGAGALATSALVQYGPDPKGLIWWLLLAAFAAAVLAAAAMPEPGGRRAGWARSLRPQVHVPRTIRATFAATLPSVTAVWALSAFFLSLVPELAGQLLQSGNLLWGGLAVFLLAGIGSFAAVAAARITSRAAMVGGCLILLVGAGLTLAAIAGSGSALFLAGTTVTGVGFGAAWTGTYRLLVADVAPADRAGLVAAIFSVAYLSLSLPAIIAGLASQHYGIRDTALAYSAVIAVLVAAAAVMTSLRRQPPRPGQAPGPLAGAAEAAPASASSSQPQPQQ